MGDPPAKKVKPSGSEPSSSGFANYLKIAPSTAYSCVYFLVGDPKKRTPEKIAASKLHLMAHSVPMRKMLEESELAERDTVTVDDMEPDTFRNFHQFVNGCDIVSTLSLEDSMNLIYVAEKYIVDDLKLKLGQHMALMISISNVHLPMVKPECLEEPTLKNAVDKIIQQQTNDLVCREEYLQLNTFGILNIVKQKVLALTEIELWRALLRWAHHHVQSEEEPKLRRLLAEPLKHVRFCTLDLNNFAKEVATTDILSNEEIASVNKAIGGKPEFEKYPTICYETIKRDYNGVNPGVVDFLESGFTKVDLANSSYIYITTKTHTVYLLEATVVTPTSACTHGTSSISWSGKVVLTKITDEEMNTSSEMPVECSFSESLLQSTQDIRVRLAGKLQLLPESRYRLEFVSMSVSGFQRFSRRQGGLVMDRGVVIVSLNEDCPTTHFKSLSFQTSPYVPPTRQLDLFGLPIRPHSSVFGFSAP